MINKEAMFSSTTDLWATPQKFFDELDREFHFGLDPCATVENAKCEKFFTKDDDGLTKNWGGRMCFAILRMVEILASGLRKRIMSQRKIIHWLLCFCRLELTQSGFMSGYMERLK